MNVCADTTPLSTIVADETKNDNTNNNDDDDDTSTVSGASEPMDEQPIFQSKNDETDGLVHRPEDDEPSVVIPATSKGNEPWGTLGMRPSAPERVSRPSIAQILQDEGIWTTHMELLDELPPTMADLPTQFTIPQYNEDTPGLNRMDYADTLCHDLGSSPLIARLLQHHPFCTPSTRNGFMHSQLNLTLGYASAQNKQDTDERGMYVVLFGRTKFAETVSLVLSGFYPWFHINVPEFWTEAKLNRFCQLCCRIVRSEKQAQYDTGPEPNVDICMSFDYGACIYGWYSDPRNPLARRRFRWIKVQTSSNRLRKQLLARLSDPPPRMVQNFKHLQYRTQQERSGQKTSSQDGYGNDNDDDDGDDDDDNADKNDDADTPMLQTTDPTKRPVQNQDYCPGLRGDTVAQREWENFYAQLAYSAPLCNPGLNGHTPYLRRGDVHFCDIQDYGENEETQFTYKRKHLKSPKVDLANHTYVVLKHPPLPFFANEWTEPIVQYQYTQNITVTSHVRLPAHVVCPLVAVDERISTSMWEASAPASYLTQHPAERDGQNLHAAPIVSFFFDGEMIPTYDRFPESFLGDETRVMSVTISRSDRPVTESVDVLLAVGEFGITQSMYDDPQTIVRCYPNVPEALHGFRKLLVDVDADIVSGYNIFGFDCPFWNNEYVQHLIPQRLRGTEAMHCFFLYAFPRVFALYQSLGEDISTTRAILNKVPFTTQTFKHEVAFSSVQFKQQQQQQAEPDTMGLGRYILKHLDSTTRERIRAHPAWQHAPSWKALVSDTVYVLWSIFKVAYPKWHAHSSSDNFSPMPPTAGDHEKVAHTIDKTVQNVCGAEIWNNVLRQNHGSPLRMPMVHAIFLRRLLRVLIEQKIQALSQQLGSTSLHTTTTTTTTTTSQRRRQHKRQTLGRLQKKYQQTIVADEYPAWNASYQTYSRLANPYEQICQISRGQEVVTSTGSDTWWHTIFTEPLREIFEQWSNQYASSVEASPMVGSSTIYACFRHPVIYNPEWPGHARVPRLTSSSSQSDSTTTFATRNQIAQRSQQTQLPFFQKGRYHASCHPYIRVKPMKSQGTGNIYFQMWGMPGRIQFDLLHWVRGSEKLNSYALKNVAQHYFKGKGDDLLKDDLGYREMFKRVRDPDPSKRAAVMTYARQDARVCAYIMDSRQIVMELDALGRLTNVPMSELFNYGQQRRSLFKITRRAFELGYMMTQGQSEYNQYFGDSAYKGACVVTPQPGIYDLVMVLDFKSLYPTLMILLNLDFSNLIQPSRVHKEYAAGVPIRVYDLEPRDFDAKSYENVIKRRKMADVLHAYFVDHHAIRALDIIRQYQLWVPKEDTTTTSTTTTTTTTSNATRVEKEREQMQHEDTLYEHQMQGVPDVCKERMQMCVEDTREVPDAVRGVLRTNRNIDNLQLPYMCPGYLWCKDERIHGALGQLLVRRVMHQPDKITHGILPVVLDEGLTARNVEKELKADAATKAEANIHDKKQIALKLLTNSFYGFTGSPTHRLACIILAAAVTSAGRYALNVLFRYCAIVYKEIRNVYGDTDSIMPWRKGVHMTVKEGFEFGKRLGYELSTRCFGSPMELEFEKLYAPYILFDKQKKYCGHKFEKSLTDYDVEHKGTPDVKRDYPRYFQTIYHDLMSYIEDNATSYTNQSVFECLRPFIDRLSNNDCTVDELQTSSSLNNDITNATAVSKAWERMKQRQDPDTPQSGDRLAYAHVYSPSKYNRKRKNTLKTRDYTESVSHIRRHNVPLDANYYLDKLATTLNDVMKCVDPDNSHANVRIDTTDEHYTFRNAVLEYIERGKRRFQDVMEAKYIQPTNARTTKRDVLENEQGESLIDQLEKLC